MMKLAQALILRADTQKRLEQLKGRLLDNAKIQENERPSEDPKLLLKELDRLSDELFRLILAINLTNSSAKFEGVSLTEMIAKKDTLSQKASVLRDFAKSASQKVDLYSNSEIKILSSVDVATLQKQIDELSKEIRELDMKLQEANWQVDLVE
jgi:septicolysin